MQPITEFAPAKVNLYLHVTGKRPDYHELDMLIAFADIGDRLHFAPSETLSLTITGPFADALAEETDNLVMRAARALQEQSGYSQGAAITLEKHVPIAAGIGGGSSDAAATLLGLNRLWDTKQTVENLGRMAAHLGADVPMCLFRTCLYASGRGEAIATLKQFPELHAVLVNPRVPLSTAAVFQRVQPPYSDPYANGIEERPLHLPTLQDLYPLLLRSHNDLQPVAIQLVPAIDALLQHIQMTDDCVLARMSGAGATCFGLYATARQAEKAAAALGEQYPAYWIHACQLG